MSNAATYQCPNCNGVLTYDASSGCMVCSFCGSSFEQGDRQRSIPIAAESVERKDTEHVTTVEEFLEHAPWQASGAAMANAVTYSCPSCGAEVVVDQSIVATACPYCSNNMMVSGIADSSNIPRWILPFSVTRDQAEANLREHFNHKWYLSRKFDAELAHMQGIYVPYHLYDIRVWGNADYIGYHEVSDSDGDTEKWYYAIKRTGYAAFERIPVDGSSKMPDAHMDAISPFDFSRLVDFSPNYAAGYLMEVADEGVDECLPRAESRARNSFEGDMRADACRDLNVDGIEEVVRSETNAHVEGVTSCVLPVWLMHCSWNSEEMLFAVNGETGRCIGDLPIDGKRRAATIVATIAIMLVLIAAICFVAFDDDPSGMFEFVIGGAIFTLLAVLLVDSHFKGQMRTAVEATEADMSYTSEGLVVTERWRSKKSYARKSKARAQFE